MRTITVTQLCARFRSTCEFAVIDPREEGLFTFSHLLAAANLPLSRLELTIGDAVPEKQTEIILVDDLTGASGRAQTILNRLGYSNIVSLEGGITAWAGSGLPLFSGINVPGKAFGEYVERAFSPPAIDANALRLRLESGLPTLLIDTRTPQEHADYCIPGALSCPNGELAVRALPLATAPDTVVVAHCAGRTRSIIGAQTLRDLGVNAPVFALENGTIAWETAGFRLECGANRPIAVTDASREAGQQATRHLARQHGVEIVGRPQIDAWQSETRDKTIYVIDVRTKDEYDQGHLAGARHVPGGQLVQNVDRYVVVRNARVVLVDDDGVRALTVAVWLRRMGLPHVCAATLSGDDLTEGSRNQAPSADPAHMTTRQVEAALERTDTMVLDIRSSLSYRCGHIAGSHFLTREDLRRDIQNLPGHKHAVLVADDESHATLMARDLAELGIAARTYLAGPLHPGGGSLPVETGYARLASPPNDMHYDAENLEDVVARNRENRRYIDWEIALIDDIRNEPSVRYLQNDI